MSSFHKTILKNGIRVVTENHPNSKAISIGVWVLTGTRDEAEDQGGISHLLEHLVFKGTANRNSYEIAKSLEALGGDLNAFTTREFTCYHALVLKDHWREALSVLSDLVCNMKVSAKDFRLEKGVILQEIAMSEENLEELIYDDFFSLCYQGHPLGRPILGTIGSLAKMTQRQVNDYYNQTYAGNNLIISVAGNIDQSALLSEIQKSFKNKKTKFLTEERVRPEWHAGRRVVEKASEQVHLLMGWPSATYSDEDRFEAFIANAALGGGMTSYLYQSIREKKGLAYSVHSSLNTYVDSGSTLVYAACELSKVKELAQIVMKEIKSLRNKGIKKSDVEMFKTQICGSILLSSDDVDSRMNSLGVNEMVFSSYRSIDDVIRSIKAINVDSVNEYIQNRFKAEDMAGVLMGSGVQKLDSWWSKFKG